MTMTADPRAARGWWTAGELRRPVGQTERPLAPPPPILRWRDVPHRGLMSSGLCIICWGFADDPRHVGLDLAALSRAVTFTTTYSLATRA